jgi:hypothetical protein
MNHDRGYPFLLTRSSGLHLQRNHDFGGETSSLKGVVEITKGRAVQSELRVIINNNLSLIRVVTFLNKYMLHPTSSCLLVPRVTVVVDASILESTKLHYVGSHCATSGFVKLSST